MSNRESKRGSTAEAEIDRGFTYRVTVASLLVGLVLAALAGGVIFGLSQPIALDAEGNVNWSVRGLLLPIGAAVTGFILFWSIFNLPVRIAKRRGVILDPEVWPWTGAVLVAIVVGAGFFVAVFAGLI